MKCIPKVTDWNLTTKKAERKEGENRERESRRESRREREEDRKEEKEGNCEIELRKNESDKIEKSVFFKVIVKYYHHHRITIFLNLWADL